MKKSILLLLATECLLHCGLQAATYSWKASSGIFPDQVSPAMKLVNSSSPEIPQLSAGVLTIANDSDPEGMFYDMQENDLVVPEHLTVISSLRMVSSDSIETSRAAAAIVFGCDTGVGNTLRFGVGEIFLSSGSDSRGPAVQVDTTSAFHTYRIEVSGRASGSLVEVYYDEQLKLTGTTYSANDYPPNGIIRFGDESGLAHGNSQWKSLSHNAAAVGPQPASTSIDVYPGIAITGTVGSTYRVQYTLDLNSPTWTDLEDVTLLTSPFMYFDPRPINQNPKRFYRAIIAP